MVEYSAVDRFARIEASRLARTPARVLGRRALESRNEGPDRRRQSSSVHRYGVHAVNDDGRVRLVEGCASLAAAEVASGEWRDRSSEQAIADGWNYLARKISHGTHYDHNGRRRRPTEARCDARGEADAGDGSVSQGEQLKSRPASDGQKAQYP